MVIINSLEALALGEILQKSLYAHYKFQHKEKSSRWQNGKRIVITRLLPNRSPAAWGSQESPLGT